MNSARYTLIGKKLGEILNRVAFMIKMPDCECLATCPFFNDSTYGMPEMLKERYCKGDYAWCGRYMAFKALEEERQRRFHPVWKEQNRVKETP